MQTISAVRDPQGRWSMADLLRLWFQQTTPSGNLNQLFVEDGQVTVLDQKLGLRHQIQHLSGSLKSHRPRCAAVAYNNAVCRRSIKE